MPPKGSRGGRATSRVPTENRGPSDPQHSQPGPAFRRTTVEDAPEQEDPDIESSEDPLQKDLAESVTLPTHPRGVSRPLPEDDDDGSQSRVPTPGSQILGELETELHPERPRPTTRQPGTPTGDSRFHRDHSVNSGKRTHSTHSVESGFGLQSQHSADFGGYSTRLSRNPSPNPRRPQAHGAQGETGPRPRTAGPSPNPEQSWETPLRQHLRVLAVRVTELSMAGDSAGVKRCLEEISGINQILPPVNPMPEQGAEASPGMSLPDRPRPGPPPESKLDKAIRGNPPELEAKPNQRAFDMWWTRVESERIRHDIRNVESLRLVLWLITGFKDRNLNQSLTKKALSRERNGQDVSSSWLREEVQNLIQSPVLRSLNAAAQFYGSSQKDNQSFEEYVTWAEDIINGMDAHPFRDESGKENDMLKVQFFYAKLPRQLQTGISKDLSGPEARTWEGFRSIVHAQEQLRAREERLRLEEEKLQRASSKGKRAHSDSNPDRNKSKKHQGGSSQRDRNRSPQRSESSRQNPNPSGKPPGKFHKKNKPAEGQGKEKP